MPSLSFHLIVSILSLSPKIRKQAPLFLFLLICGHFSLFLLQTLHFALLLVLLAAELLCILLVALAWRWRGFLLKPLRPELVNELNLLCRESIGDFYTIRMLFNIDLFRSDCARALVKQLYGAKSIPSSKMENEKQFRYNLIDMPHVRLIDEQTV